MPINKASAIVTELNEVSNALLEADGVGVGADIVIIDANIAAGVSDTQLTSIESDINQLESDIQDLNTDAGGILDTVEAIDATLNNYSEVISAANSFPIIRAITSNRNAVLRAGSTGLSNSGSSMVKLDIETSSMSIINKKVSKLNNGPRAVNTNIDLSVSAFFGKSTWAESFGKVFADGTYLVKPRTFFPNYLYGLINNVTIANPNSGDVVNIHQPLGPSYAHDNGTTNWVNGGECVGIAMTQHDAQTSDQLVSYSINIDGHNGKHVFTRYAGENVLDRQEVDLSTTNVTYLKNVVYDNDNDCYYGVVVEADTTTPDFDVGVYASVIKVDGSFNLVWRTPTICQYTTGSGSSWSIFGIAYECAYKLSVNQSTSEVYMVGNSSDVSPVGGLDSIYKIDSLGNVVTGDTTVLPYTPFTVGPNGKNGDMVMLTRASGKRDVVMLFDSSAGSVDEAQFYDVDMLQENLAMYTDPNQSSSTRVLYSGSYGNNVSVTSFTRLAESDLFFCSFDIKQGMYDIQNDSTTNHESTLRVIGIAKLVLDSGLRPKLLNYTILNNDDVLAVGRI